MSGSLYWGSCYGFGVRGMNTWVLIVLISLANGGDYERELGTYETEALCWNAAIGSALWMRVQHLDKESAPNHKFTWTCKPAHEVQS